MSIKTCRDCGNVLEQTARGCPGCALNFEAENKIDRFLWRRVAPTLFVVVLVLFAFLYWWRNY
jgi:predicted amidophosphoribosyltransferase